MSHLNRIRIVVVLAAVLLMAGACGAAEDAGDEPSVTGTERWGPLAVVGGRDGSDGALVAGTLSITEECVQLDEQGELVLLIWPDDLVTWSADRKSITVASGSQTFELVDGDTVTLGGGGSSVGEGGLATADFTATIDWVNEPSEACVTDTRWFVGQVVDGNSTEPLSEPEPGVLVVPDCPDTADCAAGFVLDGVFYSVECTAVQSGLVTDEEIGRGDFAGMFVTVNLIEGVDPEVLVAVSLPGGICREDELVTSGWSAAFRTTDVVTIQKAICAVGDLNEAQQVANGCVEPTHVVPQLSDGEIEEANATIKEFLDYVFSNDEAGAIGMWTGYPERASDKEKVLHQFLNDNDWIRSVDDIGYIVVPSAGSVAVPVVTVHSYNDDGHAVAFVLSPSSSDSPPMIQRLPTASPSWSRDGNIVTFNEFPVEGGARAFINGIEIDGVEVDYDTLTTSVVLPDDLPDLVFLTVTFATPELPAAVVAVFER